MSLLTVKPTKIDERIARTVARKTNRRAETVARGLTWGADEKILLALAAAGWILSRTQGEPLRRAGNHALLVAAAASVLPHLLKSVFDQTRPDRKTVLGHVHGISFSGKREDAFPSGHALHMGALASAAGPLPAGPRAGGGPLSDAHRRAGALGERRRRRLRPWCGARTNASPMDGLSRQGDR